MEEIMELIYEIFKISIEDPSVYNKSLTKINVIEQHFGFFKNEFEAKAFIKKHNHDTNCFFIIKTYILNPIHNGQVLDNLTEGLYDINGKAICKNNTYHFTINFNNLSHKALTVFKGRDDDRIKVNEDAWFYDAYDQVLQKCIVKTLPINTEQAKHYDNLEFYDDSYIVYPLPLIEDHDTHQHILSSYMLTDSFVESLCK